MKTFNTRATGARTIRSGQGSLPAAGALTWLVQDQNGASIVATAQKLMQAEQVVRKQLPPVLAHSCRVANLDRQCLTLAVPGAAHATRLRQLTGTLLRALNERGWHITQVEIRVQAGLAANASQRPPREIQALDRRALDCFRALEHQVAPGPLADAIARLLRHHGAA